MAPGPEQHAPAHPPPAAAPGRGFRCRAFSGARRRRLLPLYAALLLCMPRCCACLEPPPSPPLGDLQEPTESKLSQHNFMLTMQGFIQGVNLSQTEPERKRCWLALKEVSPALKRFLERVAGSCRMNNISCVPAISQEAVQLSNSSRKWAASIHSYCPKHFNIMFTAAYDPLLPQNMLTLGVIHAFELHKPVTSMYSAMAHRRFYDFGFHLGAFMDLILPLVHLPPDRLGLRRITHGFVFAFSDEGTFDAEPETNSTLFAGGEESTNEVLTFNPGEIMKEQNYSRKQCLDYVQGEVERVAGALIDLTMGSLLNYTCYRHLVTLKAYGCMARAFTGLTSLGDSISAAYQLLSALQKATCPKRFVEVMNRFQDKRNLTLDFYTNLVVQFADLQVNVLQALENLFDDRLFDFGHDIGVLLDRVTRPAFYKFERLELPVQEYSWPVKLLCLALFKAIALALSLLPLLCLFCSAFRGRPSKQREITVWTSNPGSEVGLTYQFFGGRKKIGTEIEIFAETLGPLNDGHPGVLPANPRGITPKSESLLSEESGIVRARTTLSHSKGRDIMERASYCVRLTLTDELPRRPQTRAVLWKLLSNSCPCFAKERRWKMRSFRRGFTEADGGYEDWHEEFKSSRLSVEIADWMRSQVDSCRACAVESTDGTSSSSESFSTESSPKHSNTFRRLTSESAVTEAHAFRRLTSNSAASEVAGGPYGEDACSLYEAGGAGARHPRMETRMYVNYEHVKPPVPDKPQVTIFSAHRIHAALLRLKPADTRRECFDALLLASAAAQLASACWQGCICVLSARLMLGEGMLPTLWLQVDRFLLALLVIHKKLHAIWYLKVQRNRKVNNPTGEGTRWSWTGKFTTRTPTTVPLFTHAPSIMTGKRPFLPCAYRMRYHLAVGDVVCVVSPYHKKCGRTGVVKESMSDASGQKRVQFTEGEQLIHQDSLELAEKEDRARHVPIWHDRMTAVICRISLWLWLISVLLLHLLGEAMSDDNGCLVLSLRRQALDPLNGVLFGTVIFFQCCLVAIESLVRFCQFFTVLLAQAAIYKV